MRTEISHTDKIALGSETAPRKPAEATQPRVRMIRLDRHIRQAEWAELLRGRC